VEIRQNRGKSSYGKDLIKKIASRSHFADPSTYASCLNQVEIWFDRISPEENRVGERIYLQSYPLSSLDGLPFPPVPPGVTSIINRVAWRPRNVYHDHLDPELLCFALDLVVRSRRAVQTLCVAKKAGCPGQQHSLAVVPCHPSRRRPSLQLRAMALEYFSIKTSSPRPSFSRRSGAHPRICRST
jgi:hypothetical protein